MDQKTKNFLFLLGAAPMGMAGCLGDGDDSDTLVTLTTAPFTTFNNEDDTTNGDGDGDSGDGDGDSGDGDGDGDSTGDGDGDSTGDGDGDSGDGDGDGDSGDGDGDSGVGALCTPYSELIGECYGAMYIEDAYMTCAQYYSMSELNGVVCLDAYQAFMVCLSALPCADLSTGCEQTQQDYVDACS